MSNLSIHCYRPLCRQILYYRISDVSCWVIKHLKILIPIAKVHCLQFHVVYKITVLAAALTALLPIFSKSFVFKGGEYFNLYFFTRILPYFHSQFASRVSPHTLINQNGFHVTLTDYIDIGSLGSFLFLRSDCLFGESLQRPRLSSQFMFSKNPKGQKSTMRKRYHYAHVGQPTSCVLWPQVAILTLVICSADRSPGRLEKRACRLFNHSFILFAISNAMPMCRRDLVHVCLVTESSWLFPPIW